MTPGMNQRMCFLGLLALCFLSGCVHSPPQSLDALPVTIPPEFSQSDQMGDYSEPVGEWSWVDDFESEELEGLVRSAIEGNWDLKSAAARLEIALANRGIAGASRFPEIDGNGSASRNKRSSRDIFSALRSTTVDNFNLGFGWNWEMDIWGRLRNEKRSAIATAEAAEADYAGARLSVAGAVVRAWLLLKESLAQEQLARETLENFRSNIDVVTRGYAQGIFSALDVSLIRANAEAAESQHAQRVLSTFEAKRSLQILIGQYPDSGIETTHQLPSLHRPVPAALPSELLSRRPDLRSAERSLAANLENQVIAKKSFLPQIRLTGNYGVNSQELKDLIDPTSVAWNVAGNFTQPIFQGGRLWGTWKLRKAQSKLALSEFVRTALIAFMEVETTLQAEQSLMEQFSALQRAASENDRAADIAWKNYERGLNESVITVLEAQRRAFSTQSQFLQTYRNYLQNRVDIHMALGGSFVSGGNPAATEMAEDETTEPQIE